jgi:hypothetical protein
MTVVVADQRRPRSPSLRAAYGLEGRTHVENDRVIAVTFTRNPRLCGESSERQRRAEWQPRDAAPGDDP